MAKSKDLKNPQIAYFVFNSQIVHRNVKCNCGHTIKDHYIGGFCYSSEHQKKGKCGCTYFHPNNKWVLMQQQKALIIKNE